MIVLDFLEPEVAGGHGEKTCYNTTFNAATDHPSDKIIQLHYVFDGWLGDELLESTPAFIISDRLMGLLQESDLVGYRLEPCVISTSDEFTDWFPDVVLPSFVRFIPEGSVEMDGSVFKNWTGHDFCLTSKAELVVSEKALRFLTGSFINNHSIMTLNASV